MAVSQRLPIDIQLLVLECAEAEDQAALAAVCQLWRRFLWQSPVARSKRYVKATVNPSDIWARLLSLPGTESLRNPSAPDGKTAQLPKKLLVHRVISRHVEIYKFKIKERRREDGQTFSLFVHDDDEANRLGDRVPGHCRIFADDPLFILPATEPVTDEEGIVDTRDGTDKDVSTVEGVENTENTAAAAVVAPRLPKLTIVHKKWRLTTPQKITEGEFSICQLFINPSECATVGEFLDKLRNRLELLGLIANQPHNHPSAQIKRPGLGIEWYSSSRDSKLSRVVERPTGAAAAAGEEPGEMRLECMFSTIMYDDVFSTTVVQVELPDEEVWKPQDTYMYYDCRCLLCCLRPPAAC
ncbi:hypothetical protein DRE_01308 [Drechslerella stenobrocha 248]|uniref:F-box domain-containing protein n=1 Tax=Drechslerella stenobrocha 248 TaxID=1043628 RepID=W7HJ42_9PEZI|nr:hypothetical protein DRE_01308 [Drechslerella stenobrocha 248]